MACDNEYQHLKLLWDERFFAYVELTNAELKLEDEQGVWEEETAATAGGVAGLLGSLVGGGLMVASGPAGWGAVLIGLGTAGSGGAIYASESDRQDDIDSAQSALEGATRDVALADRKVALAQADWCRCRAAQSATPSGP